MDAVATKTHVVTVHVNDQPVEIEGPKARGKEIKQAAIAQGVKIEANFVLSQELSNGRRKVVGDDDEVTVNTQSRFVAVAPDDNS